MKPLGSRSRKRSNTLPRNGHKLHGGVTSSCCFTAAPAQVTGTLMFRERIILRTATNSIRAGIHVWALKARAAALIPACCCYRNSICFRQAF
jgi:hypothetical protein